jgi:hypothetical protein
VTTTITPIAVDGDVTTTGMTTFQLSITLPESAGNVYSIYGMSDDPMTVPAAFQVPAPFGTHLGGANPAFFGFMAAAQYDSWLSIGFTEGDTSSALATIGIDFDSWDTTSGMTVTDGAVFFMDPSAGPTGPEIVLAQLTVPTISDGTTSRTFTCGCQGRAAGATGIGTDWQEHGITFELP